VFGDFLSCELAIAKESKMRWVGTFHGRAPELTIGAATLLIFHFLGKRMATTMTATMMTTVADTLGYFERKRGLFTLSVPTNRA